LQGKPYQRHLKNSSDLITPYEAIRAGFVSLALERNRQATPTVVEARNLKTIASTAGKPSDLLSIQRIRPALLTAAGVSDKAAGHMEETDKSEAIRGLMENFLEPAGSSFVEELVYRFLLTRGDALGGSMRNIGGALAQRRLTRTIIGTLALAGKTFHYLDSRTKSWVLGNREDADIEIYLRGLSWRTERSSRTLIYNLKVPIVDKNIDICLFDRSYQDFPRSIFNDPARYICLGELKGGIDPAGADEHWKTARTSLSRIRDAFSAKGYSPLTFFVGAAIEKKMAEEIWDQLTRDVLQNAANSTNTDQLASLCSWLCEI
jgi:type II restriction enzyme